MAISDASENIATQLQEIELLQAMFPRDGEIIWHDPSLLLDAQDFIEEDRNLDNLRHLSFDINIDIESSEKKYERKICLSLSLPTRYPDVYPDVSLISNNIMRTSQSNLNKSLHDFMSGLPTGEIMILEIINWVQENSAAYFEKENDIVEKTSSHTNSEEDANNEEYCFWIYMHHIYSKDKRRSIMNWAKEYNLTGFVMGGKPGIICVEGNLNKIEKYCVKVRSLIWRKMTCKVKEKLVERVFESFTEERFDVHGDRSNHMDMGKFYIFLKEKGLGDKFKELFGVEGHESHTQKN